jgi:hypothetical protein
MAEIYASTVRQDATRHGRGTPSAKQYSEVFGDTAVTVPGLAADAPLLLPLYVPRSHDTDLAAVAEAAAAGTSRIVTLEELALWRHEAGDPARNGNLTGLTDADNRHAPPRACQVPGRARPHGGPSSMDRGPA